MAEGIFQHLVDQRGLSDYYYIDSAGTAGYHIGSLADSRMRETAKNHGIILQSRGRQIQESDLEEFDLILAMDSSNMEDIMTLSSENATAVIQKMGQYYNNLFPDVPDPYYGGKKGFEDVYEMLWTANENLLEQLENERNNL